MKSPSRGTASSTRTKAAVTDRRTSRRCGREDREPVTPDAGRFGRPDRRPRRGGADITTTLCTRPPRRAVCTSALAARIAPHAPSCTSIDLSPASSVWPSLRCSASASESSTAHPRATESTRRPPGCRRPPSRVSTPLVVSGGVPVIEAEVRAPSPRAARRAGGHAAASSRGPPVATCQATLKTDPLATSKTDPRRNGVCCGSGTRRRSVGVVTDRRRRSGDLVYESKDDDACWFCGRRLRRPSGVVNLRDPLILQYEPNRKQVLSEDRTYRILKFAE